MQKNMNLFILVSVLLVSSSLYCMEKECSNRKSWGELTERSEKNNPRGQKWEKIWRPQQNNSTNNRNQHQNDWQQSRRDNSSGNKNNDRQLQALIDVTKESNALMKQFLAVQSQQLPAIAALIQEFATQQIQNLLGVMQFQHEQVTTLQETYNHLLQGKQEELLAKQEELNTKMWRLGCDRNQLIHQHTLVLGRHAIALEALSLQTKSGDNNNNNDTTDNGSKVDLGGINFLDDEF